MKWVQLYPTKAPTQSARNAVGNTVADERFSGRLTTNQASIHTCTRCNASIVTNGDAAWCIPCGRRMRKVAGRATR